MARSSYADERRSQAFQRFVAVAIATAASAVAGLLGSPELRDLVLDSGLPATLAAILLAALPPIITAVLKYAAGPTEKIGPVSTSVRGRTSSSAVEATGQGPGLFG